MDAGRRHWLLRYVSLGLSLLGLSWCLSPTSAADLSPWQDDANLYHVQCVGARVGYAVGDHGVVWRTEDAGTTWQPRPAPQPAMLRCASFLTDRIGWVAGTLWQPFTGLDEGVIYATTDGGETWQRRGTGQLSSIVYVRYFSAEEAIAVARPTAAAPSGLYRTADGGHTWLPVAGEAATPWQAAMFLDPELGIVAGREGRLSLVGGDQLLASRLPPNSSRAIRGLTLQGDDTGWLVGDGGLVLNTTSGGVVWSAPPGALPDGLREVCDFRCVAARSQQVWMAGSPGSVIWVSNDAGATWRQRHTGQNAPLNHVAILSPSSGIAVGEFGTILQTMDGGETWQTARGADRHAAWLALLPEPAAADLELGVKLSAEEGYRGVLWSASHQPISSTATATDSREQLSASAHAARVNVAGTSWQLPVDRPDLLHADAALLERWQVRAEQRAPVLLVNELIRQLRTYRPDVVILPYVSEGDALASFIQQAGRAALEQAADPTRALQQQELAGLTAWKVSRVFQRLPDGSHGEVTLAADDFLPRLGDSLHNLSVPATSILKRQSGVRTALAYRLADTATGAAPHVGGFFAGLDPLPDSATRRMLLPLNESELAARQRRVQSQRNFRAYSDRALGDTRTAAQLIGQLPDVLRDLQVEQATVVMSDLARTYRERSQYENAEATYLELIRRHTEHPAAIEAMVWLLKYWSSAEVAWQRTRNQGQTLEQASLNTIELQQRIQQASGLGGAFLTAPQTLGEVMPDKRTRTTDVVARRTTVTGAPPDAIAQWHRRAGELARQLQQQSPGLFQHPEVLLPLAALKRATKSHTEADAIYRKFQQGVAEGTGGKLMERELWVSQGLTLPPRHLAICRTATTRPHLDGILSDPCWQEAPEIPFGPSPSAGAPQSASGLMMFAYDREFLFIAAVVKRSAQRPIVTAEIGDRDHDADLVGYDRLGIALDADRDYTTWYELEVDERGQTADRCWEDAAWNPQWYVARDTNAERWQIEIAIPWSELARTPPEASEAWALSIVRTIPHEAHHSWSQPAAWPPAWDSFGLLRFE